ncbi:DUF559 domain-containing protein [Solirubrobacter ginsenosidimutans]|uniref:DUF559 domain-containing protein n=1 Tax=Solirubrobacter ginsenosidimutans TaxID=490573 RepID=A0A9X3MYL3_9ACTN|nr:type IV toxin-antitoxin system AbiEi family antitoxin domain-containing protein [Solirubrobacter ginsenosidimutans]MDA0161843.1 DUF559 domain-containing protein [Solirubrobacter ginsenosidimutans]
MGTETVLSGKRASSPPVELALAELAARQHGVITIAQLIKLGVSHSATSKRVSRGALHRVGYGVYAVGHGALSREGVWLAGVLAGGPGAVLSHRPAGKLLAVSRFPAPITEVTSTHRRESRGDVRFHRTRVLDALDVTTHLRIPVTSVHRLLVDLSDVLTPHQLANVIHEAAFRGRFVESATRDAMARVTGRHRLHVLSRAIALHRSGSAGTKSGAEDAFLALVGELPEPFVNVHLAGFERDFHWPEFRLAVEIDGPGHGRPATELEDAARDRTLSEAGYTLLRFTDEAVYRAPREVLTTVAATLYR